MRDKIVNTVMVSLGYLLFTLSLVILEILAITGADRISGSLSETGNAMLSLAYAISILILNIIPTATYLYVILDIWCGDIVGMIRRVWAVVLGMLNGGLGSLNKELKQEPESESKDE